MNKAKGRSKACDVSEFSAWFVQQYGNPPLNESEYLKLGRETIPKLQSDLAGAERKLTDANSYRIAKQYALYAWCAAEKHVRVKRPNATSSATRP